MFVNMLLLCDVRVVRGTCMKVPHVLFACRLCVACAPLYALYVRCTGVSGVSHVGYKH